MANRVLIALVLIGLFGACASKKKVVKFPQPTETEEKVLINSLELNNINYLTFSGSAKTKVAFEKQNHDINMSVRIERGKTIWISMTAMLGIEVARVLITPERIQIMNRLHGEYYDKPFDYIYKYTSRALTFSSLQDILIGNVSSELLRSGNIQVASSENDVQVIGSNEELIYHYLLNENQKPQYLKITQSSTDDTLESYYGSYDNFEGYRFARKNTLLFNADQNPIKAELEYTKVSFNEVLEFPFNVPSRYKTFK